MHEPSHHGDYGSDVVSIVDHSNQETVCTAHIIRELLKSYFPLSQAGYVLGAAQDLLPSIQTVLVVSSNGCFQNIHFALQLCQAQSLITNVIPIIAEGSFQFPGEAMFQQLRTWSDHLRRRTGRDAEDLVAMIQKLFEQIAIHVCPQDSQGVLEVRAATIARRLDRCEKTLATAAVGNTTSAPSTIVGNTDPGDTVVELVEIPRIPKTNRAETNMGASGGVVSD